MKNLKPVQIKSVNQVNKNASFVLWSKAGVGKLNHIMQNFPESEFNVSCIRMSQFSKHDVAPIPVLQNDGSVNQVLTNVIQNLQNSHEDESKPLVLIFDELSSATGSSTEVLYAAVELRKFGNIQLKESDIVLVTGLLDSDGNAICDNVPDLLMRRLAHYSIDFSLVTA
jgi:hypothetical protein